MSALLSCILLPDDACMLTRPGRLGLAAWSDQRDALQGNAPVVFFGPHGGTTLRIVETSVQVVGKGQQQAQGAFLKTDNKKPIFAMAAFPGGEGDWLISKLGCFC